MEEYKKASYKLAVGTWKKMKQGINVSKAVTDNVVFKTESDKKRNQYIRFYRYLEANKIILLPGQIE